MNRNPIVDQLVSNEPMEVEFSKARVPETSPNPHHRRVTPVVEAGDINPLHLRIISLPKTDSITRLYQDYQSGQMSDRANFYYDATPGEKTWVYVMDTGFVFNHNVREMPRTTRNPSTLHDMPYSYLR